MALNTNDACVILNTFIQGDVYIPANTDGVVVSNVNGLVTVDWTLPEGIVRNSLPSELVDSNAAKLDLAEAATAKANAALIVITGDVSEINADIAAVGTATNVQVRDMMARLLAREKKALQRERVIIKALMRLVNK